MKKNDKALRKYRNPKGSLQYTAYLGLPAPDNGAERFAAIDLMH